MREKQTSDVNLLMSSNTNEERNQEIVQKLKEMLHKKNRFKKYKRTKHKQRIIIRSIKERN